MTMSRGATYAGKPVEELTREELIDAVYNLASMQQMQQGIHHKLSSLCERRINRLENK